MNAPERFATRVDSGRETSHEQVTADVCLLLEGTWPYVRGGVSSWINQMILGLPHLTFSVLFIGGEKKAYPKRNYELPPNVVHLEEVFIESAWQADKAAPSRSRPAAEADLQQLYRVFHHPLTPDESEVDMVLDALAQGRLSLADMLRSKQSWQTIAGGYREHCSDPSFINFFWTLRTIQSPVLMLAEAVQRMPRARTLHTISTGYAGLAACILKRRWGCELILSEHGIYTKERKIDLAQAGWVPENPDEALSSSMDTQTGYIRTLWIRFFERIGLLVYRSSDPIVSLYEGNRQRQIKDGAAPGRTQVIPNGIDLARWAEIINQRPAGIAPVVGLVGRVVPIKDVKTFIRAMRGVVSALPEAEGWVVGPDEEDPDYAAECRSLVTSLGLERNIRFLGFQRVHDILPKLGVMLLTSISEAQPLVILEAWCAGTPVVCTDVGCCRELIEGVDPEDRALGVAGEVVAIADPQGTAKAVLRLLRSQAAWSRAQQAGLARAHRYYGEALMLQRYEQIYRTAVERD
ncbi:GT4 family glycosyltransferase PelF [Halopseudomonas nanhaiensis]|uniref:GT4 family glycosyltransferase PelF n=1 Tax=Halopseudomonas nanhaiensis TaxID=2830842 RepID=UPI001CBB6A9E|nr:GT4 family glycosyltransferase PelF [Halopseudomonas nanhaiensis]UAW99492.1 GT4 family glycosyltransferase PelF [Halopseudomonas nanhaiensis]